MEPAGDGRMAASSSWRQTVAGARAARPALPSQSEPIRTRMCKVVPICFAARVVFSPREQVHDFSNNASNLIMAVIHLLSICSALSVPDSVDFAEELAGEALEI